MVTKYIFLGQPLSTNDGHAPPQLDHPAEQVSTTTSMRADDLECVLFGSYHSKADNTSAIYTSSTAHAPSFSHFGMPPDAAHDSMFAHDAHKHAAASPSSLSSQTYQVNNTQTANTPAAWPSSVPEHHLYGIQDTANSVDPSFNDPSNVDPAIMGLSNPVNATKAGIALSNRAAAPQVDQGQPNQKGKRKVETMLIDFESPENGRAKRLKGLHGTTSSRVSADIPVTSKSATTTSSSTSSKTALTHFVTLADDKAWNGYMETISSGMVIDYAGRSFADQVSLAVAHLQQRGDFPHQYWLEYALSLNLFKRTRDGMLDLLKAAADHQNANNDPVSGRVSYSLGIVRKTEGAQGVYTQIALKDSNENMPSTHAVWFFEFERMTGEVSLHPYVPAPHSERNMSEISPEGSQQKSGMDRDLEDADGAQHAQQDITSNRDYSAGSGKHERRFRREARYRASREHS